MRSSVLEVRSRHEQVPPHGKWKDAICKHAHKYVAQSPPHAFGHTDWLRCAGGGKRLDNTGLQAALPKLFRDVLTALVGAPTNNTTAQEDDCRSDEQLKRLKSLTLVGQQVDGGSLSVPVGYFADVPKAAYGHWREGPHYVPVVQRERPDDLAVSCLGVSKLLSFAVGVNVAVRDSPPECDASAVSLA